VIDAVDPRREEPLMAERQIPPGAALDRLVRRDLLILRLEAARGRRTATVVRRRARLLRRPVGR
jgi:hypothetical protein